MLTPNYASPEQVAGASPNYRHRRLFPRRRALQAPHRPGAARQRPARAGRGFTSPTVLAPDVPRDLDFIVRKALRPEPEERYASVDNFAADIRAALDWRPVQARSGDLWYRWRRFLRRYWVPVLAAGLVIASLAGGLYVADRQRVIAQRRFLDVRQLANKLFDIEVQVRKLPGATNVRQLIVDTSLEYLQRLSADARTDPALALETATAYTRVAHVQRYDAGGDSPRKNSPDETLLKAQALIDSVLQAEPRNRIALLRSADITQERMLLARHTRPDDALRFARETTKRLNRYLRAGNVDWKANRKEASEVIAIYLNLAHQYARTELFDETMYVSRRAVELARTANWPNYEGGALVNVAWANRGAGQLEEALQAIRGAVRILEFPPGERVPSKVLLLASALIVESQILADDGQISLGRFQDAIAPAERAVDLTRDLARRDLNDFPSREKLASAATTLGNLLRHTDPARALQVYDSALERLAEVKENPGARLDEVTTLAESAGSLQRLGRAAEARQRLDQAFQRLKDQKVYPAPGIVMGTEADDALRALARYEADAGNVRRAAELYQELLRVLLAGGAHPETSLANALGLSNLYQSGAPVNRRAGLTGVADAWITRRLELWQRWDSRLPGNAFVRRQLEAARAR